MTKREKEVRTSIEYNKLVDYWNNRTSNGDKPTIQEMNDDLKAFRDNDGVFIEKRIKQLSLF